MIWFLPSFVASPLVTSLHPIKLHWAMCSHSHLYCPAKLSKVPLFQGQMLLFFFASKAPPAHLSANCTNCDDLQLLSLFPLH